MARGFAIALIGALLPIAVVNPFKAPGWHFAVLLGWLGCCLLIIAAFSALTKRYLHLALLGDPDPASGLAASASMIGLMLFLFLVVLALNWIPRYHCWSPRYP